MEIQNLLFSKYVDPRACSAFSLPLRLQQSIQSIRKKSPVQIKCKNPFTPKLESGNHHKLVNSIFVGFLT